MRDWLDPTLLAAAHPKSGQSALPDVDGLFIGTWVSLGIIMAFVLVWAFHWRRLPRVVKRPWWTWLGWGLALIASVDASLLAAYFLGSGALGWAEYAGRLEIVKLLRKA